MPKILVVNEIAEISGMIKAILEAAGFEVKTSESAKEAMEAFYQELFDLVITDLTMPGSITGEELLWVIKESESDTEAIVLTSAPNIDSAVECLRNDLACDYLTNPIDSLKGFVASVHKALKKRSQKIKNKQRKRQLYSVSLRLKEMNKRLKETQLEVVENEKKNVYDATILTAAHSINQPLTVLLLKAEMIEEKLSHSRGNEEILDHIESIKKSALKVYDIMDQFKSLSKPVFKDYLEGVKMIDLSLARTDKEKDSTNIKHPPVAKVSDKPLIEPPPLERAPEKALIEPPPISPRSHKKPLIEPSPLERAPEKALIEPPPMAHSLHKKPLIEPSPLESTPSFLREPPELVEPKTILIIEDEVGIKDLICEILNNHGYNTISAINGDDGFRLFKLHQEKVELIITDIRMPILNGIELYHKVMDISPKLPVICLTGYDIDDEAKKLHDDGKIKLLTKPFSLKKLVFLVKKELDGDTELLKASSERP